MSTPTVSLEVLRTVHRIHKQLTELRDRRDRGPRQILAGEAGIRQREDDLNRLREELKAMRKGIDQKQLQWKTSEQKIKDLDTKLNKAASNREYQILKDQIAADKMANSVLEDETIEMMEQVDAFLPKVAEAEAALRRCRKRSLPAGYWSSPGPPRFSATSSTWRPSSNSTKTELPETMRDTYQRLVRRQGEDALAEVVDGACGGCCHPVPVNVQANIRLLMPTFCRTCGRLLYIAEGAAAP